MNEENYFTQIKDLIEKKEVNTRVRAMQDNSDTLSTYWNIGRLIVEAQGGETKAKYGDELIKEWSKEYSNKYGKGYSSRNLRNMRKFYIEFRIWQPVVAKLNWSHCLAILPIKNEMEYTIYKRLW